jgi:hypothetical protein
MKKIFLIILTITLILIPAVVNAGNIRVQLNGQFIDFKDDQGDVVDPEIINDRTMVPMRKIFEELGATVEWNPETRTVTGVKDDVTIVLTIDNMKAKKTIDGQTEEIDLDSAPVIINGRTMVPVRFIAESLNKQVGWQADEKAVIIIDNDKLKNKLKDKAPNFYEFINSEFKTVDSYNLNISITGLMDYKDYDNSKNNEKINLNSTIASKYDGNLINVLAKVKLIGSGSIYDYYKDAGLNDFSFEGLVGKDKNEILVKSEVLGAFAKNKWLRSELDPNYAMLLDSADTTGEMYKIFEGFFDNENDITIDSYNEIDKGIDLLSEMLSDKNFTVSGSTSKTYTLRIDKDFIIEKILNSDPNSDEYSMIDELNAVIKLKVKDGILDIYSVDVNAKIEDKVMNESITLKLSIKNDMKSYNNPVNIAYPKESDII